MKHYLECMLVAFALAAVSVCSAAAQPKYVPGEILVKYKAGVSSSVKDSINKRHGSNAIEALRMADVVRVTAPKGSEVAQCKAFKNDAEVEYAEPNYIAYPCDTVPTDTYFSSQWDLSKIQAPAAWDITTGSSSVTVAVIDTGVDYNHPDLTSRMVPGYDFYSGDSDPMDEHGHGTKAAGVIGALSNNAVGVAGITWNCKIMPLRAASPTGYAPYSCIANAIIYAADHGARVASISIAGSSASSTLQNAANYAFNKGCVVVAGSGNDSVSTVYYPAACDNVIAVGATDSADNRIGYSNYGSALDVCAPGYAYTTLKGGGYGTFSGTSSATPHVSGIAALIISKNPGVSAANVVNQIKNTADDIGAAGWDIYTGAGRVNAYEAVCAPYVAIPDTTAPTVSILSPTSGSTVSSSIAVNVAASDNVGVAKVELYCDSTLVGQSSGSGYITWNTASTASGQHSLNAVAYDAAGNRGQGSPVTVSVNNVYSVTQVYNGTTSPKAKSYSFTTSQQANVSVGLVWSGSVSLQLQISDSKGVQLASNTVSGGSINLSLGSYPAGTYKFSVGSNTSKVAYTLTIKAQSN